MNLAPCIIGLSERQRSAVINLVSILSQNKKVKPIHIDAFIDDCAVPGTRILKIFGVNRMSLHNWVQEGCPKNADNSYAISAVHKWLMDRATASNAGAAPGSYKEEKLKKEIEFLQARIDEKNDVYITRELHETVLTSRAGSLREYFEKTFMSNAISLTGKTVDEVRAVLWDLLKRAMDAYIGKSTEGG